MRWNLILIFLKKLLKYVKKTLDDIKDLENQRNGVSIEIRLTTRGETSINLSKVKRMNSSKCSASGSTRNVQTQPRVRDPMDNFAKLGKIL